MYRFITLLWMAFGVANAHQMSPTYPVLEDSYLEGISVTKVKVFNKREDVKYYEIGVFDKDFKPIPFVAQYKLRGIDFNEYAIFDIYLNNKYSKDATYICSESMLTDIESTGLNSKICSKIKK